MRNVLLSLKALSLVMFFMISGTVRTMATPWSSHDWQQAKQTHQNFMLSNKVFTGAFDFNQTTTVSPNATVMLLDEDFEGAGMPAGWTTVNTHTNPNSNWHLYDLSLVGETGKAIEIEWSDNNLMNEWLITPQLDFSAYAGQDINFSFDFYMSYYWMVSPYDGADLMVKVSTDNGATWTQLWQEEDFGTFSNWTWYTPSISLNAYAGMSNVKIAFQYYGDDGAQVILDNIKVSAEDGGGSGGDDCEYELFTESAADPNNFFNTFAGVTFDMRNDGDEDLTITGFKVPVSGGALLSMDVYYTTTATTNVGVQTTPSAWTLLESFTNIPAQEATNWDVNNFTQLSLTNTLTLTPGQSKGFYVLVTNYSSGISYHYTNGNFTATDNYLTILSNGFGSTDTPFGATFASRAFVGEVQYTGDCGNNSDPGDDCSIEYAYSNENGTGNTQTLLFADDFAIAADTTMTIDTVHFTIINNITDFTTIAFYENNNGQPTATPIQSFSNITPDSQTIVDNNFGFNFYDVAVSLPATVELSTGTYWVAFQNTVGTDGGTNYWAITNSSFGQPGKYSTDGGATWTANSSAFNFAFTLEGTCEGGGSGGTGCDNPELEVNQSEVNTCMANLSQGGLAQSYKPLNADAAGAGIKFESVSTGLNVTLSLWDGLPNAGGNMLAIGTTQTNGTEWADVFWDSTVGVTVGNTYYIVIEGDYSLPCISGSLYNPYSDGMVFANNYDPWPDYDYTFRTYSCEESSGDGCDWTVHVWEGYFGDEVHWELRDAGGVALLSGGPYGLDYDDTKTVTAEGPLTFWISNVGTFGDNEPFYTVSNENGIIISDRMPSGGETRTYDNLNCADTPPPPPDYTCEENQVPSGGLTNGYFFSNQLAVDIISGQGGFDVYGVKLNLFVENGTDLSFSFNFFNDGGGIPGAQFDSAVGNVVETEFVGSAFGYDVYSFTVAFDHAISINENTTNWMQVISDGFAWESTTSDAFGSKLAIDNGGGWSIESEEFVYSLVCEELGVTNFDSYQFAYYPNPVKDVLNIASQKQVQSVSVFNLAGQKVINNAKMNNNQIDLGSLSPGAYIFRVVLEGNKIETFKIIKK